ncbi:MAG: hypothetical protein ACLT8E_09535 [Akkermansia sp.]
MLALFGFLGYQILKDKEPVAKAVTVPCGSPKPKSKPAPPNRALLVAPEPEPVVVAPERNRSLNRNRCSRPFPSPEVIAMEKALREEAIASRKEIF